MDDTDKLILNPSWTMKGLSGAPFAEVSTEDECLHIPKAGSSYAHTETSYFCFGSAEHLLEAQIYMWFHPVLNVMSAGVFIYSGKHRSQLSADFVHHHHFLPMPDQIGHYRVEQIGLEIEVVKPLETIRMQYRDHDRPVAFDVTFDAVFPPVARPNGKHFVQVMHTRGALELHGRTVPIDGLYTRDRSWGDDRHENCHDIPPITWMTANIDASLAMHLVAFDDPARHPDWAGQYDQPGAGENLMWGCIWRDGECRAITVARKLTHRAVDDLRPLGFSLDIVDIAGQTLTAEGEVVAQAPWHTWQNMVNWFSLVRWNIDGRIGYSDCQDIHYNPYVYRFSKR